MSAFYFGQPVRIKADPRIQQKFVGMEATFHSYGTAANRWPNLRDDCCIVIGGEIWGAAQDLLEPILPRGLESPAEIAALYEPESVTA